MATTIISENNHQSFSFIKSSKGCIKLIEGGFIYGQQRRVGEVVHWQCERRGICKARVHTKGSQIVKRTNEHLYEPDEESVTCQEVKIGMKRKASETQDSSHLIVGDSLLTVSDGVSVKLPKLTSLKRTIQRQRERILAAPTQPLTLEELILPPDYQQTAKGENFLFHDSGSGPERILIFGTRRNLEMLESSQYWLADGTFKTAPELFLQVYVIHALRGGPNPLQNGHLLPSLFVLLPNKTQATYTRMWQQIKALCPNAHPNQMIMDFEKAAINSFEHVWPVTFVKCCFFHLTQNVWRKVQSEGLQSDYNQDAELAILIRLLPALAFAAPHEVPHLFGDVVQQLPMPQATGLVLYFENTYIGRTLPGGTYQRALFPIEMWNYHFDTPFGLPRTTNIVEAWHRSFNATVGCSHPSIWKFIASLKREQGLVEVRQAKFIAGAQPPKRVKSQANEQALKELIASYLYRPRMEFLRGVAHHFSMDAN